MSADTTVDAGVTLAVAGGTFSTDTLTVTGTARLRAGTITIGDSFWVSPAGELEISGQDLLLLSQPALFGDLVLEQTTLSAPSMIVKPDASLDLDSGRVSLSGTFTNQEVVRMGNTGPATIRAEGLINTGAILGRGSIQAPVTNAGNIGLNGDSSFTGDVTNQPGGKIIVSAGSAVTFFEDVDNQAGAEIRVGRNSTATYFGEWAGGGSFTGTGTSYIEGDLRPGASPAEISVGGDMVFGSAAGLQFELADPDAGPANDRLDVVGDVYLDGTLRVEPLSKLGTFGDLIRTIITSDGPGGVIGTFGDVPAVGDFGLPDDDPGRFGDYLGDGVWFGNDKTGEGVIYVGAPGLVTAVELAVFQAIAGDTDGDRDVDSSDLNRLADNYTGTLDPGTGGSEWRLGDFDGDGDVDFTDFNSLTNNYTGSGGDYTAVVPEPGTLVLLACGAFSLLLTAIRRRRKTSRPEVLQ